MSRKEMNKVEAEGTIDDSGIIPFADETPGDWNTVSNTISTADEQSMDAQDLGVTAEDEFGDSQTIRRSVVDAALGLDEEADSGSGKGRYECPCCNGSARRVVRVRMMSGNPEAKQARWVAVCAVCAASILAKVPGTIVGGPVSPSRRRAKRADRAAEKQQGTDAGFRQAG